MNARSIALAATLVIVGCGDPELTVRFEVPPLYRESVASTSLSIYTPPAAAPFTCEDVAFGEADPAVLRASLVAEVVERERDATPLADIDRLAPKLFLAEGHREDGMRVVAGCVEVQGIEDDTNVVIRGQPVTRTGTITESIQQTLGMAVLEPVVVTITDVRGELIAGADVRWRVEGSRGAAGAGRATSDGLGRVSITPELPPIPGPFVLDVQVRWAETDATPIPGFVVPNPEVMALDGRIYDVRAGRIGPNGEPGFVALASGDLIATRRVVFVYRATSGELLRRVSQSVPAVGAAIGLLKDRGTRDRVIVVTDADWYEMTTDGAPLRSDAYQPPQSALGRAPEAIHVAGSCVDDGSGPQVIISYDAAGGGIFEENGLGLVSFGSRFNLLSAGCLADDRGTPVRMLVLDEFELGLVVAAELEPHEFIIREWFAVPSGMSFARSVGGAAPVLLGTQLSVNDFVVSRLTIRRLATQGYELVMGGLDSPPAVPSRTRGGEIDDDATLDVVSLFVRPRFVGDPIRYAVWAVLGREHRGRRIAGDFDLPMPELTAPEMMLIDLDADKIDDVVIVERSALDPTALSARVEIYSMGLFASSAR